MALFQNKKWIRILFWVWAAILFAGVRFVLSFPLRNQWGSQQLTDANISNLCSLIALAGVVLPLVTERKQLATLSFLQFIRFAGKYLLLSHLLVALLVVYIVASFDLNWSIQVQGIGLLVFIASCPLFFRLTVKD